MDFEINWPSFWHFVCLTNENSDVDGSCSNPIRLFVPFCLAVSTEYLICVKLIRLEKNLARLDVLVAVKCCG